MGLVCSHAIGYHNQHVKPKKCLNVMQEKYTKWIKYVRMLSFAYETINVCVFFLLVYWSRLL